MRGRRSIHGAAAIGTTKYGTSWMAMTSAEASVEPVSSKTMNESAKPPAMLPIAPSAEATVTSVKSRVRRVVAAMSHRPSRLSLI